MSSAVVSVVATGGFRDGGGLGGRLWSRRRRRTSRGESEEGQGDWKEGDGVALGALGPAPRPNWMADVTDVTCLGVGRGSKRGSVLFAGAGGA